MSGGFMKKEVKNPKSVFLGVLALLAVVVFCIILAVNYPNEIWPSQEVLFQQRRLQGRLRADLEKGKRLCTEYQKEKDTLAATIRTFYRNDDENKSGTGGTGPDLYLRQRIEHAAKFAGLVLKSMSSVRRKKICDGTFSLELSISAEGEFEKIIIFMQELNKKTVRLHWGSCYLRPVRGKGKDKDKQAINISGALKILCTDGKILKAPAGKKAGAGGKRKG